MNSSNQTRDRNKQLTACAKKDKKLCATAEEEDRWKLDKVLFFYYDLLWFPDIGEFIYTTMLSLSFPGVKPEFWKLLEQFVRMRLMPDGFSVFSKQVCLELNFLGYISWRSFPCWLHLFQRWNHPSESCYHNAWSDYRMFSQCVKMKFYVVFICIIGARKKSFFSKINYNKKSHENDQMVTLCELF